MNKLERKVFEKEIGGKTIKVEFNSIAHQAHGSVMVSMGGTTILGTSVMSPAPNTTIDYFPLKVDYEERFYAAGRILGSRFMRREGRPSEEAVLTGRLIDRTIRPLFDKKMRHDIQVTALTLSLDPENSPDVLAIMAGSLALHTSDIPWGGPVSAVRAVIVDGKTLFNPTGEERANSTLDLVVSGGNGYINMLEGKAKEIPEDTFMEVVKASLAHINELNIFQEELRKEVGDEKRMPEIEQIPEGANDLLVKDYSAKLADILFEHKSKESTQKHALSDLKHEWMESSHEQFPDLSKSLGSDMFEEIINGIVHEHALKDSSRQDGRKLDEVRSLLADTGLLSRTHGSGLFFRGDTHILSIVTLGSPGDDLLIEGMTAQTKKHFMHHYNFPPFSVGETGRMGSPGRREIGHGALAEKALEAVIPSKSEFPYTIRLVSETMASNGSSSMGSVCASTLALMDAGVPIKRPVTGIAMGLMMENDDNYRILTDIQGPEDHHGDMDFKAAGTTEGITAVQMDVKVKGVTINILKDVVADAKTARLHIMKTVLEALPEPRKELSQYAPRILQLQIPIDKIRDVIGPGGKTINEIIDETGAQVDIEQTGDVFVTGNNADGAERALERIKAIVKDYEAGETVKGKVSRVLEFGAMVEFAPRKEGLIHISELANFRVGKVTDIVGVGDDVEAKILDVDGQGRVNLSLIALTESEEETKKRLAEKNARRPSPRNGSGGSRPHGRPRS
ncbi:MAG: polyribonucleotide nucleotidyltransferase [bacterium]|nr:polyribonucleotide nucleotidyltransferase [bacterium]